MKKKIFFITILFFCISLLFLNDTKQLEGIVSDFFPGADNQRVNTIINTILTVVILPVATNLMTDFFKKRSIIKVAKEYEFDIDSKPVPFSTSAVYNKLKQTSYRISKEFIDKMEEDTISELSGKKLEFIDVLNWEKKGKLYQPEGLALREIIQRETNGYPQSIFIIGEPGVGKTSSIHKLITEHNSDTSQQTIAVHFSLNLWIKDMDIVEWLAYEMNKTYQISKIGAKELLNNCLIFPIFDGLDQVGEGLRTRCLENIVSFSSDNQAIITCRPKEFESLELFFSKEHEIHFSITSVILNLLPLPEAKVRDILIDMDCKFLVDMLPGKPELLRLLRYPMILFVVIKIKDRLSAADVVELVDDSSESIYNKLWQKYDENIFDIHTTNLNLRKTDQKHIAYGEKDTRKWLNTVAKKIGSHILIENLQPGIMHRGEDLLLYYLFSRIISSIVLAVAAGLFLSGPIEFIDAGIISGTIIGVITYFLRQSVRHHEEKKSRFRHPILNVLIFGLPILIFLVAFFGFSSPRATKDMRLWGTFAVTQANIGVFITMFMCTVYGLRESLFDGDDIKPVEIMKYNLKQFFAYGLFGGVAVGTFLMLCVTIFKNQFENSAFDLWIRENLLSMPISMAALVIGFFFGFLFVSLLGILKQEDIKENIDEKIKPGKRPNEGIRKSMINVLKGSIPITIVISLILGSFFYLLTKDSTCTWKGMKAGLGAGLLVALWFGGTDVLNHFTLRSILFLRKYGPFFYVRFFDFSSRLRFISPTGSRYSFTHDTLHKYFEEIESEENENKNFGWLCLTLLLLISIPICNLTFKKVSTDFFWKQPVGYELKSIPPQVQKVKYINKYIVIKNGNLLISADGRIYVGAFAGYTYPEGTEAGFMGFKLGDTFDIKEFKSEHHGALIVKHYSQKVNKTHTFKKLEFNLLTEKPRQITLVVKKGDILEFIINDTEWENNFGKFNLQLDWHK